MADLADVANKVRDYMQALDLRFTFEGEREFSLRLGSARGFVRVWTNRPEDADPPAFVKFTIPILFGVKDTPELYEWVAFHADDYVFGTLSLFRTTEGELRIFFTHDLLGDYMDLEEFKRALFGMMSTADDLDEELQAQFGGKRFHEDD